MRTFRTERCELIVASTLDQVAQTAPEKLPRKTAALKVSVGNAKVGWKRSARADAARAMYSVVCTNAGWW